MRSLRCKHRIPPPVLSDRTPRLRAQIGGVSRGRANARKSVVIPERSVLSGLFATPGPGPRVNGRRFESSRPDQKKPGNTGFFILVFQLVGLEGLIQGKALGKCGWGGPARRGECSHSALCERLSRADRPWYTVCSASSAGRRWCPGCPGRPASPMVFVSAAMVWWPRRNTKRPLRD